MVGYRLLRKDGKGRQREGVALYVREQLEYVELWEWERSQWKVYGLGLKGGQAKATLLWVLAIGHLMKKNKWMRLSKNR